MAQAEVPYQEGMELHHPHSWWTKYWFSQDHKVIAVQYGITAMAVVGHRLLPHPSPHYLLLTLDHALCAKIY